MLSSLPWAALGTVVLKVSIVYWFMMLGLKCLGRRAFGQMGPQEFILIAILAKIMADQIIPRELGLLGNITGALTLFFYVALIERIPFLRRFLQGKPIPLLENGIPITKNLKRSHLSEDDLKRVAREYGFESYDIFQIITLEQDGRLTGVLKPMHTPAPLLPLTQPYNKFSTQPSTLQDTSPS